MFKAGAPLRLRERLECAPRHFNGLVHIFVVTMGRLSFADVPEWVQEEDKQDLERVAGMLLITYCSCFKLIIAQGLQRIFWSY